MRIFDYETGEQRELHKGHHGPAHIVSYSPDGQLAASGSEDGESSVSLSVPCDLSSTIQCLISGRWFV